LELIRKYFPDLSSDQYNKLAELGELYNFWNKKINLISRKDIDKLYERHILSSLSIALIFQFKEYHSVLDAGTGGGFPGIPLSIIFPDTDFLLVDSIGKKIMVVDNIIQHLKLKNVSAKKERIEMLNERFNFIISRAISSFPVFVGLSSALLKKVTDRKGEGGRIYLKGGDINNEIKAFKNNIQVYKLNEYIEEEYFETKKIIYMPVT